MSNKPILDLIRENFPNAEISHWCSDLYVEYTPEIYKFCKDNFLYPNQVRRFFSRNFKRYYIEIPFACYPYIENRSVKK